MSNLKVGQLVRPNRDHLASSVYNGVWRWYGDIPTPTGATQADIDWNDTFIVEELDGNDDVYIHHLKSGLRMIPVGANAVAPIE